MAQDDSARINGSALAVGAGCYLIWGLVPLAFQIMGRLGIGAWEILAHRTLWAVPTAFLFVALAGQTWQLAAVLRNALASVESGELAEARQPPPARA